MPATAGDLRRLQRDLDSAARTLRGAGSILIISHIDADGISAGAIADITAERLGKDHTVRFEKKISEETVEAINSSEEDIVWICDLGSGYLSEFERDGINLWTGLTATYPKLVLGGEMEVKTLEGDRIMLKIPAGTQVGAVLRIPGKGLPRGNTSSRGDLFVRMRMDVPKKVTDEQRELLMKLDSTAGTTSSKRKSSMKDKIREKLDL